MEDAESDRCEDAVNETSQVIFFDPNEGEFSQWHPAKCNLDGIEFNCAEQLMMYAKAKLFGDDQVASIILKSTDPKKQKELGRRVRNFDPSVWTDHCEGIVKLANFLKNADLQKKLLLTEGKTLALATKLDAFWGIGLSEKDKDASLKSKWRGLNKLGNVLMEIRDELLEEERDKKEIEKLYESYQNST
ncbi:N-glycosidase YbiA-like isoform X2 [Dysidea avara]|uniref:N-glycosidase YbiA-like isoform X2 n=1 Tax=Dysidea avara TaxID=196820 RepID=UPI00332DBCFD